MMLVLFQNVRDIESGCKVVLEIRGKLVAHLPQLFPDEDPNSAGFRMAQTTFILCEYTE
jgi:hypothetical protein